MSNPVVFESYVTYHTSQAPIVGMTFKGTPSNPINLSSVQNVTTLKFEKCTFQDNLIIPYNKVADFNECTFENVTIVNRNNTTFEKNKFTNKCKIKTLEIQENGRTEFKDVTIDNLNFVHKNFNHVKFEEAKINTVSSVVSYSIDKVDFIKCKFNTISGFVSSEIKPDAKFQDCEFTNLSPENLTAFRQLKKEYSQLKNEHLADYFGALENKTLFLDKTRNIPFVEKAIGSFYYHLNDFGLDTYRPLYLLIGLALLIGFFDYTLINDDLKSSWHNAVVALSGPFKLLSKDLTYTFYCYSKTVLLLNLITGVLWFFLILGIRKKFKIEK